MAAGSADMREMDFFYFFGSVYAYPAVMRIANLAGAAGVKVRWRPFNVRTVMAENNVAFRTQVAKVKYMWRDIERRCACDGVPFVRPPIWPADPDLLTNRVGVLASREGWCEAFTTAAFKAWFLNGMALGDRAFLDHVLPPLGKDVDETVRHASGEDIAELLKSETDVARQHGIFGSPSFVTGGETFWGDDRLEEAIAWASGIHKLQMQT
jgi:2-hydroxychromene-2-carboxylate isomerase